MKQLPPGLQDHLDTGTTTLCRCWKLIRDDQFIAGFTDHDRDLEFDAVVYKAATGFASSEHTETIGLNVGNMDIDGVLSDESLSENDLAAGLYDNATIELYTVNWQDVSQRVLMQTGSIGEVTRTETAFTAEIRSLSHYLQQPKGRLYQYGCDANLGDGRCGVLLNQPPFTAVATVLDIKDTRSFTVSGLEDYATDWFANGLLLWSDGPNSGLSHEVKFHITHHDSVTIELWSKPRHDIEPGVTFEISAGCDKQFSTCKAKFNNALNFRGFPHMPGNDFALSYPNRDDGNHDGQSMQVQ